MNNFIKIGCLKSVKMIKIYFDIEKKSVKEAEEGHLRWGIEGGIGIKVNDLILTKPTKYHGEFRGNYILHNYWNFITAISEMLEGCDAVYEMIDEPIKIYFKPKGNLVTVGLSGEGIDKPLVSIHHLPNGIRINKDDYATYPKNGVELPLDELIPEIIKKADELINKIISINPKLSQSAEIKEFRDLVKKAQIMWNKYKNEQINKDRE